MSAETMARPKKIAKPEALDPKTIAFRVSGEYGAWVERLAGHNRSTVAGLLDQALVKFARDIEFEEKAPQR